MSEPVFVIQNQHGLYLTRQNEWNDGHEPGALFKTPHRDIALNTLIELNAKDIELRGSIVSVTLSEKGLPLVTPVDAITDIDATTASVVDTANQQASQQDETEDDQQDIDDLQDTEAATEATLEEISASVPDDALADTH